MAEYDLCVNITYGWIWSVGEYKIWVYFGLYSPQLEAEEEQQQEHDKLGF